MARARAREEDKQNSDFNISLFHIKNTEKKYGSALNFTQSFLILGAHALSLSLSFYLNVRRLAVHGCLSSSERFLFFRRTGKNIRLRIIGLRVLPLSLCVYAQYNLFRHHHSEQFTIWFFAVVVLWCLGFSCFDRSLSIFPFSFLFV